VVVSAAVQPEGVQRAMLEAQAMARPVIVSDLGAGPEVVLSPPAVPESRITGLRFPAGDDAALAGTLLRLFSMPEPTRRAMGTRGRTWVLDHFDGDIVAAQALQVYGIAGKGRIAAGYDADLTIVDMKERREISNDWIASRCGWTPYAGMSVNGWPVATVLRGGLVMRDGEIVAPARGEPVRFVETLGARAGSGSA